MYSAVNSISDNWNDNLQSLNQEKNEASVTSHLRGFECQFQSPKRQVYAVLDVSFIPPLPKKLPYMANNDEYLCCDFLLASFFGRSYHSRYQNFEFTGIVLT